MKIDPSFIILQVVGLVLVYMFSPKLLPFVVPENRGMQLVTSAALFFCASLILSDFGRRGINPPPGSTIGTIIEYGAGNCFNMVAWEIGLNVFWVPAFVLALSFTGGSIAGAMAFWMLVNAIGSFTCVHSH